MLINNACGYFKCQHVTVTVDNGTPLTVGITSSFEQVLSIFMLLVFLGVCMST